MGYDDTEYHEERARKIEDAINSLSIKEDKLAEIMANQMHRTNQQSFTRLAIAWLKVCGSDEYRTDGRNEASAHVGQRLRKQLEDVYLPLI